MAGTYASLAVLLAAATLIGQAVLAVCGQRRWSGLAPAIGLAALCPLCWWAVRLPGEGTAAVVAGGIATVLAGFYLVPRAEGAGAALRKAVPLVLAAIVLASLPFIVEGRFGILGTGLNPDMSQHLFAVDRLAAGGSERLIADGYPLGPHAIVVALATLGPSTVEAFAGLTIAIAVAACLAVLQPLRELSGWRRLAGAACAGFAYLVAAYLVQGAFKETIQALFVIAFAIALGEVARGWSRREGRRALRALPLAVLGAGSVYAYSFPGLLWLGGAAAVWAAIELARAARRGGAAEVRLLARLAAPTVLVAVAALAIAVVPELGRIVDFASFETFDPAGAGLGNLFDRLSPLEALGIWPSGDFRVEPGDGAVPAFVFYLGGLAGLAALVYGLRWSLRRGGRALPAAFAAAVALWLYALLAGTPYQEAKALVMVAAVIAVLSVRALVASQAPALVAIAFLAAAGGSSVLALVNGPVGPSGYSTALADLRGNLPRGSTVVAVPDELLAEEHAADFIAWELRGSRICVEPVSDPGPALGDGVAARVTVGLGDDGAIEPRAVETSRAAGGPGPCPLIPDAARADPSAGG